MSLRLPRLVSLSSTVSPLVARSFAALAVIAFTATTTLAEPPSASPQVRPTPAPQSRSPQSRAPQANRPSPTSTTPRPTAPRPLPPDAARGAATPAPTPGAETPLMDRALTENGRLPIVARGELRDEIKGLDINDRPHRPLHFYGNTVRRRSGGAGSSP